MGSLIRRWLDSLRRYLCCSWSDENQIIDADRTGSSLRICECGDSLDKHDADGMCNEMGCACTAFDERY